MSTRAQHTVLIVEDELLLRMELANELVAAGWTVREAASGEEAILTMEGESTIDFLVTDIRLGGKADGWDVADKFRERHPDGLVIYVSANPDLAHRRVAGSVFMSKPVVIDALLATCDKLVLKS